MSTLKTAVALIMVTSITALGLMGCAPPAEEPAAEPEEVTPEQAAPAEAAPEHPTGAEAAPEHPTGGEHPAAE